MRTLTFILLLFSILPTATLAHPGNTDSSGCHTCRTNCPSWGLDTGEYHCHNSKGVVQPKEPIKSTYGENGTGYTSPAPEYSNNSSKTTTFVKNSSADTTEADSTSSGATAAVDPPAIESTVDDGTTGTTNTKENQSIEASPETEEETDDSSSGGATFGALALVGAGAYMYNRKYKKKK